MGKIVVSACLLGYNCKYSGGNNRCEAVLRFTEGRKVVAVCPEQLGGLPTPRIPAEIVRGEVRNAAGESVDVAFREGARRAAALLEGEDVEMAILQPRSPSCGAREIYDGTFSRRLIPGQGVFAQLLMEKGIRVLEPCDLPEEKGNA